MKLSVLSGKIKHYLADFRVVFFVWLVMPGVAIWYLTSPWQRNRWDLALVIFAFIITSMIYLLSGDERLAYQKTK